MIKNPIVIRAVQYIRDHIERNISLPDVVSHCQVTARHLSNSFKEVLNITVNDYINIAKVDKAMRCLTESALSISEITSRLRFSSIQYFSTVFKKYTHVTPSRRNGINLWRRRLGDIYIRF